MNNVPESNINGNDWINRTTWTERYRVSEGGPYTFGGKKVRSVQSESGNTSSGTSQSKERVSNLHDENLFTLDIMNVADEVARIVVKKQKDYGPNNIRKSPFGPKVGLVVRLYDKIARLANLTSKDTVAENESLRDTFIDIAGYGLIGLMILDGTFPEEK